MTQDTNQAAQAGHASADIHTLRRELENAPEVTDGRDTDRQEGVVRSDDAKPGMDGGRAKGGDRRGGGTDPERGGGGRRGRPRQEIFDNCPVTPLGVHGDVSYYLDVRGQLRGIDNHSLDKIRHVFGGRIPVLARHFPQFDKDGTARAGKFDQAMAAAAMVQACDECGVWHPAQKVRGPGCWTDEDGNLVIHAGDAVLIDGAWCAPGIYHGKVYAASDPVPRPLEEEGRDDPGEAILALISSWNWRRADIDPQLALGLVCAQMLGGALDWRPVGWLTGDAATGKSEFQKLLKFLHGGETGLLQAADATEAGIRSVVGYSSLPVAIDEFEPDPENPRKNRSVIELARRAASGAQIFRGSTDQKGHQSNAYSCFLFTSILVPDMPAQDRSRLILLDLDRIPAGAAKPSLTPRRLRSLGGRLRHRLARGWSSWAARLELWRAALAEQGQTGRGADNYATVLALADMALREALPEADVLEAWAAQIGRTITEESVEVGSNAEDMLTWLLSQYYDVYRRGEQFTIAQWVMTAAELPGAPRALSSDGDGAGDRSERAREANEKLAKIGLRVRGKADGAELFLPNKPFHGLVRLFEGSPWAHGVWAQAARRVAGAQASNPLRLAGVMSRGHYIPVRSIPGLLGFPADQARAPQAPTAPSSDIDDFA